MRETKYFLGIEITYGRDGNLSQKKFALYLLKMIVLGCKPASTFMGTYGTNSKFLVRI